MPRISVIIPAYNHAAYVHQAVDSVLTQSFGDLELIVHDDGSTDGTAEVLRTICDPRLSLKAYPSNQGAGIIVNAALDRAQGEYVALLNSDDYFLPGKLEHQVRFLDENPGVAAVFGWPHFVDEQSRPLADERNPFRSLFEKKNQSREAWLHRFFVIGNALCHPTVMVRRSVYREFGGYDARLAQLADYDMWIRICSRYDIHILPQPVTAYRVLEGGRNASAGQLQTMIRHDWELPHVFRRYLDLADAQLRRIFAREFAELDPDGGQQPRMLLARLALKIGPGSWSPSSYLAFALDTIHRALAAGPCDFTHKEYNQLAGSLDLFGLGKSQSPSNGSESVDALRQELEVMTATAERLKRELGVIRASTSWRLTQPLRYAVEKFRQL
jgi:glycosyltransferase involved in cell wall biosynthesis